MQFSPIRYTFATLNNARPLTGQFYNVNKYNKMKTIYAPILVPLGTRCELCKLFDVSYATVRKALAGKVSTPQHLEIRKQALELGGAIAETETANH